MKAIVYLKSTKQVLGVVEELISIEGANVKGPSQEIRGIDMTKADIIVVEDTQIVEIGDIINPDELTDIKDQLPESPEELLKRRISDLEDIIVDMAAGGGVI